MKLLVITLAIYLLAGHASSVDPSPTIVPRPGGKSGDGVTTRYWDCCKPSCAWADHTTYTKGGHPAASCLADGNTVADPNIHSGCRENGDAYLCNNQQPIFVNSSLYYGFAAASFTGGEDYSWCCTCMLLSFKGQLAGKQFLVQVVNTGSPLAVNQFDLQIPGGGVGLYADGCAKQWDADPNTGWGDRVMGVSSIEGCEELPQELQPGCRFRFEFLEGVDNPPVTFYQVECPAEIVALTGCEY
ncbi:unnamed protein product [Phaedon cochleariae]|uniref:Cellulase n=1 Tax=Phaedon cochleariae TaxID=80249 RepID=K4QDG5_PHACE|nr:unnamed protein product [Phaedon cochleariae]CCJ09456.1 glycoside hydrolase family 45 protein [Phaedon cochleariae]